MARIAVNAVVYVPADLGVVEVGGVVVPMANGALEDRVVARSRMASGADAACIAMARREGGGVSERRAGPGHSVRGMAADACCGSGCKPRTGNQSCGGVVRNQSAECRRTVPIRAVAAVAINRRDCGAGVAQAAGDRIVHAVESEACGGMIECRA